MDLLFPYQRPHVRAICDILDLHPCAADLSDTGTGKTISACVVASVKRRRLFVICPKQVIGDWFDTADMTDVEVIGIANYELIKLGKYYDSIESFLDEDKKPCPWVKKSDGEYEYEWNLPDDTLFIFDEAHKGKNNITMTSQLFISTRGLLDRGQVKMIILSATITDSVECFRTPAILLGLAQQGKHAYRAWLRTIGGKPEDINRVISEYSSRMRIRDLLNSADEIIAGLFKHNDVAAHTYDMTPEVEKEITEAYITIDDAIKTLNAKQITEEHALTIILRARQRIEMLKIPTIIMLAMEYMLNDKSVAIFVNFNESIDQLFKALDEFVQEEFQSFVTVVRGGQKPADRRYNIKSFQSDRSRVIICNVRAGGIATSLHDINGNHARVSLISIPPSPIMLKQILGRIYRANAKSDATQRIICCRGKTAPVENKNGKTNDSTFVLNGGRVGVEELLAASLNESLRTIEWINNGDDEDLRRI